MRILVINGPNMNLLGVRQPEIYGKATYQDLMDLVKGEAESLGVEVDFFQSNHEGALVDAIHRAYFEGVEGIVINTAACIRHAISDPVLDAQIDESIDALRRYFIHPEYKALLEMVTPEGELIDTINGRVINPGHCIETAWFLLEESKYRGWDENIKNMALQILDWSWEWGWDNEFGGIINFRDCKGFPAQDYSQDMKFWWPQTEAVIATLYAYEATGDPKYLEMHALANDWTYEHLPDPVYGEWFGYLHRDGSVAQPAKGNLFKGPFHIPRMLIKGSMIIDEIL